LPSSTQHFLHYHKPLNTNDAKQTKSSPRPPFPSSVSKYKRMPSNIPLTTSSQQQTHTGTSNTPSNDLVSSEGGSNNNNNN
ncbi:unnamed protein product, partial [Rotaria socialis]